MPRSMPKTNVYTEGNMDDFNNFDVPSPSSSHYYMYEPDQGYLESHTSESQSPNGSIVSLAWPRRRQSLVD